MFRSGLAAMVGAILWTVALAAATTRLAGESVTTSTETGARWFFAVAVAGVYAALIVAGGRSLGAAATSPVDLVRLTGAAGLLATWPVLWNLVTHEVSWNEFGSYPHELAPPLLACMAMAGIWPSRWRVRPVHLIGVLLVGLTVSGWKLYGHVVGRESFPEGIPLTGLLVVGTALVVLSIGLGAAWSDQAKNRSIATAVLGTILGVAVIVGIEAIESAARRAAISGGDRTATQFLWAVPPGILAFVAVAGRSGFTSDTEMRNVLGSLRRAKDIQSVVAAMSASPATTEVALGFGTETSDEVFDLEGKLLGAAGDSNITSIGPESPNVYLVDRSRTGIPKERMRVIGPAVAFALANTERREALVRVDEVRRSRRRVLEASDAARRQVERDLHDGAQQRLATLAMRVRTLSSRTEDPKQKDELAGVADDLSAAIAELRDLARGIHPAALSDGGLRAAVESLAETASIPVRFDVTSERFSLAVESTAYFVICEGLANTTKHAEASRVDVEATVDGPWLRVTVNDDGRGGADPEGDGLRGLRERVTALDGTLTVEGVESGGTRLTATILVDDV